MELLKNKRTALYLIFAIFVGVLVALVPRPEGVDPKAWNLFAIFLATIVGVVLKPFPMSAVAIFGLTAAVLSGSLTFSQAFSGFSDEIVWLVVFSFFVARGFISTGLGSRLAYKVMSLLGRTSLGLGYALVATDLILAPAIPSVTARSGGFVFPVLKALAEIFTGKSHDLRMGAFLTQAAFQGTVITSAMFLTSMAGNPLIASLAFDHGIQITWGGWAIAAIVPGLISLIIVPYVLYRLNPPTIRETPHARQMARERLAAMGPMKLQEWVMVGIFILLLILWAFGPTFGLKATIAALIGLTIMLLTSTLKWKDILEEQGAWDTFIWFAVLMTLAGFLNKLGLTVWFSQMVASHVSGMNWVVGFLIVSLLYFYSHYFFASNVAHIGAMYVPLLIVSMALGTPPYFAALILGFFSSLYGGITHYGCGPAPILFGTGYVSVGEWWKMGFVVSLINLFIWMVLGGIWWKILGLW